MKDPGSPEITQDDSHTPTAGTEASRQHLDRILISGLAWTGAARWTAQAIAWVATVALARILTQDDFGIWTSTSVYIGVVTLLSEFGIGASVVMLRDLTDRQISQINGLALAGGLVAMLMSLLLAAPIASFYRTPAVGPVIAAMSLVFVISAFRIVPASLLQRDMKFRFLALTEAVRTIVQSAVMVAAAIAGFGYWSFPIGVITGAAAWTLAVTAVRRTAVAWPRLGEIRHAISFSGDIILSRLSWYAYSNSDFIVAGRLLGQSALGVYGMAWNMASVPVEKINSIIIGVTPSLFSAVQESKEELRRYVLRLTSGISFFAFPAGIGLALVADDFVPVVLGPEWNAAIMPIRILALYAIVRSIGPILTPVLQAVGETRFALWNNVLAVGLLPAAFVIGSRWGIAGVAAGWVVAHPLIFAQLYRRVAQRTDLRLTEYLSALAPATNGTVGMTVAVLAASFLMDGTPPWMRLVAEVAVGAAAYTLVLWVFHRDRVLALTRRFVRR